ncbi:sodium/hydrogen exchanger 2-like isoform X2 [Saccostrea echinata]|uniref:sodium/hydrogen exchanger 2-like isoform X2 n=1 Tax=Saccostrea echinata TaxID=191078 RepID=UPI002A8341DF|nr:sodium/hydrogen exchanger 2-like isoform X2 [Saccostrea echinata]
MRVICVFLLLGFCSVQASVSTTDSVPSINGTSNHTSNETEKEHAEGVVLVEIKYEAIKEPFFLTLVVLIAGLSKIGFHHADVVSSRVPESCLLIILGVIFGSILFLGIGANESFPDFFTPEIFFHYLLPPIILEASFSLYDKTFADNLGSVLILAVIGTTISCFLIGLTLYGLMMAGAMGAISQIPLIQILVFSSLIVAVDPVAVLAVFTEVGINPTLYFLVFGESLLNDGVTVVLYNVMQTYNRLQEGGGTIDAVQIVLGIVKFIIVCAGGLVIGILVGCLSAVLTKFTNTVKVVEPIAIFGMAYLAFLLAELFEFSGIICIIGCGLVQVAYAFNNITPKSKVAIKYFSKVLSNTSEIIIFLFLGLALVTDHDWRTGFVLWTLVLCIGFRFLVVYGLTFLINKFDTYRVRKIGFDEMFIMSYGGLRGAVCFSLVALLDKNEFKEKDMFVTTTLFIILFTVFFQGATIKPIVNAMRVRLAPKDQSTTMYLVLHEKINDHLMAGIEEVLGYLGKFTLREKFHYIDDNYIRKLLLKTPNLEDGADLIGNYEKLMMREHYKNLHLCGAANLPKVPSDLRNVDSSAALLELEAGEEVEKEEEEFKPKEAVMKPGNLNGPNTSEPRKSQRKPISISIGGEPTAKDFRNLLDQSMRSPTLVIPKKRFDDFVSDTAKVDFLNLRKRRKNNARLQRMKSIRKMPERALSWTEEDTALCRNRSNNRLKGRTNKAMTVDYSPLEGNKEFNTSLISQTIPEDDVFGTEEHGAEGSPLITDNTDSKGPKDNGSKKKVLHEALHRQDAIENIPMENVKEVKRTKSLDV